MLIKAYVDIDQDEIAKRRLLDNEMIKKFYIEKLGLPEDVNWEVSFDKKCEIYEMHSSRDLVRDERLKNQRFLDVLSKRAGTPFPSRLRSLLGWGTICDRDDAAKLSNDLRIFFPDDQKIMFFAGWLRDMSRVCKTFACEF